MARGRNRSVSDERLLLEIWQLEDALAFAREIAEPLPIKPTRVRQILAEMDENGLVSTRKVSDVNVYSLTEKGRSELLKTLRDAV